MALIKMQYTNKMIIIHKVKVRKRIKTKKKIKILKMKILNQSRKGIMTSWMRKIDKI
jgi:hypothetical protein